MKYLLLVLALTLTSCSAKAPTQYICVNPAFALQGVQINTVDASIKDKGATLEITTEDGSTIIVPKSLCIEVRRAKAD